MKRFIYFDNAATTKPLPEIRTVLDAYVKDGWYNPSALYALSVRVSTELDGVRKKILGAVHAVNADVVFTSGGTESNHQALMHAASLAKDGHFIVSGFEHPSVFSAVKNLEQAGHGLTVIMPNQDGVIDAQQVADAVTDKTVMVSVMHVNNETGALNDVAEIADRVKAKSPNVLIHADGVQGFLKVPFVLTNTIDFYSVSAHKIGGLKGTGALITRNIKSLKPILRGGSQEKGVRAGTENTFGMSVFGEAIRRQTFDYNQAVTLRNRLIVGLGKITDTALNSPQKSGLFSPYIVNVSILGVRSETLLHVLESEGILIGTGAACSSKTRTSRIHDALGSSKERAESAVRISFGADNTVQEIDQLLNAIEKHAKILRQFKRR